MLRYTYIAYPVTFTQGADKSLARPGRKQTRKHVREVRDFNNIETRGGIKFLFLQGKAPKEIHAILTETLACFLPGRAKDLSTPLYITKFSRATGPKRKHGKWRTSYDILCLLDRASFW